MSSTLTVYRNGQFWVGLAEHAENGRHDAARIVSGDEATETKKPAKNPKRCSREAAKAEAQTEASRALIYADMNPYEAATVALRLPAF